MGRVWGALVVVLIISLLAGLSVAQSGEMIGGAIAGLFTFLSNVVQGMTGSGVG